MDERFYKECEQEQLHLSGQIQGHGLLLVLDENLHITHVSENASQLLGTGLVNLIARPLPPALEAIIESRPQVLGDRVMKHLHSDDGDEFDLALIKAAEGWLVEFYPVQSDGDVRLQGFELPSVFSDEHERNAYCADLLQWISEVTGHDRVMYYQFLDDGDGHVIGEVCSSRAQGSYLDLRFPASDIPQIARRIYTLNPWREIVSSESEPFNLYGVASIPDLTYSDLRSVSPVHLQYMRNMGVVSSVSFPVVKTDQLDALISCHSARSLKLPLATLQQIAETIAAFVLLDKELEARNRLNFIDQFNYQITSINATLNSNQPVEQVWESLATSIARYFDVDGMVLCLGDTHLLYGLTFEPENLDLIDDWFCAYNEGFVYQTDNLQQLLDEPILTEVAGFCCLKFRASNHSKMHVRLYLTRQEYIHEVSWGGNPNKPTESQNDNFPVSPRRSFSRWVEKRLGYSRAWPATISLQLHRFRALLEQSRLMDQF